MIVHLIYMHMTAEIHTYEPIPVFLHSAKK